jgi:hypothetical protein
MRLVLELRAVPHKFVAPCHQLALAFGPRVRRPNLRQLPRDDKLCGLPGVTPLLWIKAPFRCAF